MIEGKPLLQRWHPKLFFTKDIPKVIPLWVKIFNIPLQYWHAEGWGRIFSGIGNPLSAEMLTEHREASGRLSFAKMLAEVDAKYPLSEELILRIPSENFMEPMEVKLRVLYPWRPSWCSTCNKFGHDIAQCPQSVKIRVEEVVTKTNFQEQKDVSNEEGFQLVHCRGKEKWAVMLMQENQITRWRFLGLVDQRYAKLAKKKWGCCRAE